MTPYQRPDNLRRVAILVASVDDALAQLLLAELPEQEAFRVRELVERLGEIDPEEQQDVLEQFQHSSQFELDSSAARSSSAKSSATKSSADVAVEIDASLQRQLEMLDEYDRQEELTSRETAQQVAGPAPSNGGIDAEECRQLFAEAAGATLADLLADENPQVIAIVLARLSESDAAKTLARLPEETQSLVIERLVYSHPALDEVVEELESQLAEKLLLRRRHQEYFQSGSALARRILENAPEGERTVILDRILHHDPVVATALTTAVVQPEPNYATVNRIASDYELHRYSQESADSLEEAFDEDNFADEVTELLADSLEPAGDLPATPPVTPKLDPQLLVTLDDSTLQALLAVANEQVVQVYLASVNEKRFRRLTAGLPRRAAKQLRKRISGTLLTDEVVAMAQQSLLSIASRAGLLAKEVAA